MRRLLAPLLLALAVFAAPTAASADVAQAPADAVILAAEAGDPVGPNPQPRDQVDNPARSLAGYEDPEIQFTWAASFILLIVGVVGLVIGLGLWYLLVVRPERSEHEQQAA
jgi:hypothetical protein